MAGSTKFELETTGIAPGAPLGGVGTGVIEVGRDGWFRNITINNNRTSGECIPLASNSFLAVRVESEGNAYIRYLQEERTDLPEPVPCEPIRLRRDQIEWRGLFPTAHFHLIDPDCPAEITWTCFSPLVPFDHDAATMPAFVASISFRNPTDQLMNVSAVFNWENLCGQTGLQPPCALEPIVPAMVDDKPRYEIKFMQKEATAPGVIFRRNPEKDQSSNFEAPPPPRPNALQFGSPARPASSAHGEYCLAVHHVRDATYAILPWDHRNPEQRAAFWREFAGTGLPGETDAKNFAASGAVALSTAVAPGAAQRIDFALTWNCPRFDSGGTDMGNAYSIARKNAFEVSKHVLEHVEYFYSAASDLQKRFSEATLPLWLNMALINSTHVFASNSIYTRQGAFALMESPDDPETARLDRRLYSSIGTLLLYPRYEETELLLIANAEKPGTTGRLSQSLGRLCVTDPDLNPPAALYMELGAQLVLMAYRNYILSGKLVRLQDLLPILQTVMAKIASRDYDADGLPDIAETSATFDGVEGFGLSSYTAGLWLAALRVYAMLSERRGNRPDATRYSLLYKRAAETFERLYWNEESGYYRLFPPRAGEAPTHAACHTGQLAGQWYADFLGIGDLLPPVHVARALDSISRLNARENGYLTAVLPDGSPCPRSGPTDGGAITWPAFVRAHFHALEIYRGRAASGLRAIERQYATIVRQQRTFDQPLTWDLNRNDAPPGALSRHTGALSIWHVLYAVQGFLLNVPDQYLRVKPNLPPGVSSISSPLVTPLCLGWLKYKVDVREGYRQRIRIAFDSPMQVRLIELRVPANIAQVTVACDTADGPVPCQHVLAGENSAQRLLIQFERTLSVGAGLTICVAEVAPSRPANTATPLPTRRG